MAEFNWNGIIFEADIVTYVGGTYHSPPEGGYAEDASIIGIEDEEDFWAFVLDTTIPSANCGSIESILSWIGVNYQTELCDTAWEDSENDGPDPDYAYDSMMDDKMGWF